MKLNQGLEQYIQELSCQVVSLWGDRQSLLPRSDGGSWEWASQCGNQEPPRQTGTIWSLYLFASVCVGLIEAGGPHMVSEMASSSSRCLVLTAGTPGG